ncbi:hypothetical protein L6R49_15300 [Myxococcota bacterium]|nr:hypothetical protein [Myxococcota bacterium]
MTGADPRRALVWLALGPGLWAVVEAQHAPRLALLTWAVSGALALALAGLNRWTVLAVLSLGAAAAGHAWSGL